MWVPLRVAKYSKWKVSIGIYWTVLEITGIKWKYRGYLLRLYSPCYKYIETTVVLVVMCAAHDVKTCPETCAFTGSCFFLVAINIQSSEFLDHLKKYVISGRCGKFLRILKVQTFYGKAGEVSGIDWK